MVEKKKPQAAKKNAPEAASGMAVLEEESKPDKSDDKNKAKEPTKKDRIIDIVKSINKKYGDNTAIMGARTNLNARISTGSIVFDKALGGGIPVGKVVQFWGAESACKTYSAIQVSANAQRLCSQCYYPLDGAFNPITGEQISDTCLCKAMQPCVVGYCDVENTFDEDWANSIGLKTDEDSFVYVRPETSEESIDIFEALLRSGDIDIAIFDSIAAATPIAELQKSTEDAVPGKGALLMNRACRVWNAAMVAVSNQKGVAPTVITINQERFKIGVMYGDPSTRSGGQGQKFLNSIEVKMKKAFIDSQDTEAKKLPLVTASGKVTKNKTARPFLEYEYQIATDDFEWHGMQFKKGSIVEIKPLILMAEKAGFLGKDDKAKDYFYKEHRFKKLGDLHNKMIYTKEGLEALRRDVLQAIRNGKI